MTKKKGKKLAKLPFWKRKDIPPELQSLLNHVGKMADNTTLPEMIAMITCALAGGKAAEKLGGDIQAILGSAGSGVVAYKMATSDNLAAGAAGTTYLATLGLISLPLPKIPLTTPEIVTDPAGGLARGTFWASPR